MGEPHFSNYSNGSIDTINNSGTVETLSNSGLINNIDNANNATINTISNLINGSIGTISNSGIVGTANNSGSINNISNYSNGCIAAISNSNIITNINTGKSTANITNSGAVNSFVIGSKSFITVDNTGIFNNIYIYSGGALNGKNNGYVEQISGDTSYRLTRQWKSSSAETLLLMQNPYILDYLLTKEEQTAGVGVSRIGGTLYRDISSPVLNALSRDVWEFEANKGKNSWFASKVGNNGVWNLKYRDYKNDVYHWEETLGIPFWGYSTQMALNGMLVTVEQVGNIAYGYLGTAAGMSQSWMNFGSSVNQFFGHGFSQWDNEYTDQALFGLGINWYNTGVMK